MGVDELVAALVALVPPEPRKPGGPFLLAVDHCFAMRGQGTVLTGTVLAGSLQARLPPTPLLCHAASLMCLRWCARSYQCDTQRPAVRMVG